MLDRSCTTAGNLLARATPCSAGTADPSLAWLPPPARAKCRPRFRVQAYKQCLRAAPAAVPHAMLAGHDGLALTPVTSGCRLPIVKRLILTLRIQEGLAAWLGPEGGRRRDYVMYDS